MRHASLVLLAATVLGLGACQRPEKLPAPSKAFCAAAKNYERRITAKKSKAPPLDEQVQLVARIATTAPKDIRHDANVFLDAMERRAAGDKSVVDNAKVEAAIDAVNRRYGNGCGVFERKSPL